MENKWRNKENNYWWVTWKQNELRI